MILITPAQRRKIFATTNRVIFLNRSLVARACDSYDDARHQYEIAKRAIIAGVHVPTPHGVVFENYRYHLLMQRVTGCYASSLTGSKKELAIRLLSQEVEKLLKIGIAPQDFDWYQNSIWTGNSTFLLDLESWISGSEAELSQIRKKLENFRFRTQPA